MDELDRTTNSSNKDNAAVWIVTDHLFCEATDWILIGWPWLVQARKSTNTYPNFAFSPSLQSSPVKTLPYICLQLLVGPK